MSNTRRSGFRWTINEILTLQREYELLELPISEIADRHGRSFFSILSKLKSEDFIDDHTYHSEVMNYRNNIRLEFSDNATENDSYTNTEMSMDDRISFLESAVNEVRSAVSKLLNSVYGSNTTGLSCNTY
jgi:hypothetical protein